MHKSDYLAQVEALRASPELRARVAGLAGTPARRRRLRPWMGVCACLAVLLLGGTLLLPRLGGSSGLLIVTVPTGLSDLVVNSHKAVTVVSVCLVVLLGFVSIVVISNTIRLTVFARRKEINIMKYVGATNGFIRLPFFVEGIAVGLIAGAIASAIVRGGYQLLLIYSVDFPAFWGSILNDVLLGMNQIWWKVLVAFLAFGSLIGSVGTATSIRKYLHV